MIFSNGELHIILKRRNLEICEHSSFLIIDENVFETKLGVPKFKQDGRPILEVDRTGENGRATNFW